MTTEGIEAVFLETHNWGKAAKFFTELGYELEFDTGHGSGQLRNGDSPYVFIAEVPADQEPGMRLVFKVTDPDKVRPGPAVDPGDVLPDGRPFRSIDEYKQLILADKDQLARSLTEKLLAYSTGAAPAKEDRSQIDTIVHNLSNQNYGFRSLIHEIVQSPMFQTK